MARISPRYVFLVFWSLSSLCNRHWYNGKPQDPWSTVCLKLASLTSRYGYLVGTKWLHAFKAGRTMLTGSHLTKNRTNKVSPTRHNDFTNQHLDSDGDRKRSIKFMFVWYSLPFLTKPCDGLVLFLRLDWSCISALHTQLFVFYISLLFCYDSNSVFFFSNPQIN